MPVQPIYPALRLVRFAVRQALAALTTRPIDWQQAKETSSKPLVVFQSQDGGGLADKKVGTLGWTGLITVKAIADSDGAAEQLAEAVAPGMLALSAPTGYTITASYERALTLPPADGDYQTGHIWRVSLSRST